jgi:hypothetical protein
MWRETHEAAVFPECIREGHYGTFLDQSKEDWILLGRSIPFLHSPFDPMVFWVPTWVILTASSQNNNCHHIRCRKKFKDWPSNQPLFAPNSCNLQHSQQGGSSPGEILLPHGDFFSFFPSLLLSPSSWNKASIRVKLWTSWTPSLWKPPHVMLH